MFAGIVEGTAKVIDFLPSLGGGPLVVEKPLNFQDLAIGDSIAVNGVCLTVESLDESKIGFFVGTETLKVTGWSQRNVLTNSAVNLERSLRFGDRVHGHFVTGHIDACAKVVGVFDTDTERRMQLEIPDGLRPFLWKKCSVAINGVSLTVHDVALAKIEVSLIPETLRRTNLGQVANGQEVLFEVDNWARALWRWRQLGVDTGEGELR